MNDDLIDFLLDLPKFSAPARCAETDPDAFIPEQGTRIDAAKAICLRCEVRDECLAYALDHQLDDDEDGLWGGTTPRQRRKMRSGAVKRKPRPISHGTPGGARTHARRGEKVCDACRAAKAIEAAEFKARHRGAVA